MKAIRLHAFGPAGNLRYEDVPDPVPTDGMVLVEVEAAGVHLVDTMIRAGTTGGSPIPVPELPTIPGREVAGRVSAVGPEVSSSWVGKRVVVHLGMVPGGYAERAVAKVELVRSLGAQYAIDYRDPDWAAALKGGPEITVLLDGVGGANGQQAFDLLGVGGRAFLFGWSGGGPIEFTHQDLMTRGLTVGWALGAKLTRQLRELESAALEETISGRWKALTTTFALSEAAAAHQALENRATTGKVVLLP
jgi:NADPH:quinone reductase-like Zn-dependent oxidoreductase